MADLDVIRQLTYQAKSDGFDKVNADLDKNAASLDNVAAQSEVVATSTDKVAARQLSAQTAYESLSKRIDSTYAASQQYAKGQGVLEQALAQGIITQETYGSRLEQLGAKYGHVNTEVQQSAGFFRSITDALGFTTSSMGTNAAAVEKLAVEHGHANEAGKAFRETIHSIDPVLKSAGIEVAGLTSLTSAARVGLVGLGVAATGVFAVALAKAGDEAKIATQRFSELFNSQRTGEAAFRQAEQLATQLGTSVGNTIQPIQSATRALQLLQASEGIRFGPMIGGFSQVGAAATAVAATLQNYIAVDHATGEAAAKTANTIIESVSKSGKFTIDNYRQIEDASPALANAIAQAWNTKSPADFERILASSEITSQNFFRVMQANAPAAAAALAKMKEAGDTVGGSFEELQASAGRLWKSLAGDPGVQSFLKEVTEGIEEITKGIKENGGLWAWWKAEAAHQAHELIDELKALWGDFWSWLANLADSTLGNLWRNLTPSFLHSGTGGTGSTGGGNLSQAAGLGDIGRVTPQIISQGFDASATAQVIAQSKDMLSTLNNMFSPVPATLNRIGVFTQTAAEAAQQAAEEQRALAADIAGQSEIMNSWKSANATDAAQTRDTIANWSKYIAETISDGTAAIQNSLAQDAAAFGVGGGSGGGGGGGGGSSGFQQSSESLWDPLGTIQTMYNQIYGPGNWHYVGQNEFSPGVVTPNAGVVPFGYQKDGGGFTAPAAPAAQPPIDTLTSAITANTTATVANTAATTSLLSPLYLSTSGWTGLGFRASGGGTSTAPDAAAALYGPASPYTATQSAAAGLPPSTATSLVPFHAAAGIDAIVPGAGAPDSVGVYGRLTPGERLIAIPPGQNDNRPTSTSPTNVTNLYMPVSVITPDKRGFVDSNAQIADSIGRAAYVAGLRR